MSGGRGSEGTGREGDREERFEGRKGGKEGERGGGRGREGGRVGVREGGREGREWEVNERRRVVGRRTDGPIGRRISIMGAC